jgi:hypothetical protein
MSSEAFQHLKQNRDKSFSRIKQELLKNKLLPNEHSKARIRKAFRLVSKDHLLDKTLLSDQVWIKHQQLMLARFNKVISRIDNHIIKTASKAENNKSSKSIKININRKEVIASRVRFMTLLHEVVPVDQDEILSSVERLENQIRQAFVGHLPSVRVVGAIELEFLNLELMRKATFEHEGKHSGERKRDTLESMLKPIYAHLDRAVLVHLHAIIDLGPSRSAEDTKSRLQSRIRSFSDWSESHLLQIKLLSEWYDGKPRTLDQNLKFIARYITKGANMIIDGKRTHRYKLSFDQKDLGLADDRGFAKEGSEDTRNLPFESIVMCAELLDNLMSKRRTRDGYVITL